MTEKDNGRNDRGKVTCHSCLSAVLRTIKKGGRMQESLKAEHNTKIPVLLRKPE